MSDNAAVPAAARTPGPNAPARRLLTLWNRLALIPGGRTLFTWLLARTVPYSASTAPRVLELAPGHVRIALRDRRRVRNHLGSVHAIAIANIAELASGLAMTTALPASVRGIVVTLRMDYVKKARGTLIAESRCTVPEITDAAEHDFIATVSDASGEIVARATVTWRLAPYANRQA